MERQKREPGGLNWTDWLIMNILDVKKNRSAFFSYYVIFKKWTEFFDVENPVSTTALNQSQNLNFKL